MPLSVPPKEKSPWWFESKTLENNNGIVYDTKMRVAQVVLDTNVLVSGLWSRRGASYRLLTLTGVGKFDIYLSVPLVLEYESLLKREQKQLGLTSKDVDDLLDYLCAIAHRREIFFLWRPFLRDPRDDMILELAVTAECDGIVTFNTKDFAGVESFGLQIWTPGDFLKSIGESL